MNRLTKTLTASENIRVPLHQGNAVLVEVTGTGFTGTVDFKSSVDGSTWANAPYVQPRAAAPSRAVAQLSNPSTATLYLIVPPVTEARIDVAVSAGSVKIVYRELLTHTPFLASGGSSGMADGSAAAPGWAFTDDTDTGFFRPAADQIGFAVAGAEIARLTATGLGLGVTPSARLHVYQAVTAAPATTALAIFETDNSTPTNLDQAYIDFRLSGGSGTQKEMARLGWQITDVTEAGNAWDGDMILSALVNGTMIQMVRVDGSVPEVVITDQNDAVNGGSNSHGVLRIGSGGTSQLVLDASYPIAFLNYGSGAGWTFDVRHTNVSRLQMTDGFSKINASAANIDTQISGDNVTALFYVDASVDRIGLGTVTPSHLLHVTASGTPTVAVIDTGASGASSGGVLHLAVNDGAEAVANDRLGVIAFYDRSSGLAVIDGMSEGSLAGQIRVRLYNGATLNEALRIYSSTVTHAVKLQIGGTFGSPSTDNQFSTASQGAASTTMYIGNASINVTSDARVKSGIEPFVRDATALLRSIRVQEFSYINGHAPWGQDDRRYVGFTAQDLFRLAPYAVNTQGGADCQSCLRGLDCKAHRPWQARYEFLNGLLVKSIQELDQRLSAVEAAVAAGG